MRFEEILVLCMGVTGLVCLMHFVWTKYKGIPNATNKQHWVVEYSRSFFPVFVIVLVLRSFLVEPFRIPSGSMKPTLLVGDFVLVNKYAYGLRVPVLGNKVLSIGAPQTGDVIVFKHDSGKDFIKRVVGVPGDHIEYKYKTLYINGQQISTKFLQAANDDSISVAENVEYLPNIVHNIYINPQHHSVYPYSDFVVPEGNYFVLGDNRDNSKDGRYWGFVRDEDLLGKAFATWMSWGGKGDYVRWARIGRSIYNPTDEQK